MLAILNNKSPKMAKFIKFINAASRCVLIIGNSGWRIWGARESLARILLTVSQQCLVEF